MDNAIKPTATRRNKFAGKEDVSRHATDSILTEQIDRLHDAARTTDDATAKLRESVGILYERKIPVDTAAFEQLNRYFITQMEDKLRKVKRPSKGLQWYIAMWVITLAVASLAGYYVQETRKWKADSLYWYQQYEAAKDAPKEKKK